MKILCVATERGSAEHAARALRTIAPNVKLTWGQTLASAARWLKDNGDVAAILVDAQVQSQSGPTFVENLRSLAQAVPVLIVVPEDLQAPVSMVKAVATADAARAGRLAADQEAQRQLTLAVQHAEERAVRERTAAAEEAAARHAELEQRIADDRVRHDASLARAARVCTALQERLMELEAALRHAEQAHATEAASSVEHLALRHAEFTASLTQAARSRDALAHQLSVATAALDDARETRAREAAEAAAHLARREAELGDALGKAVAARAAADQQIEQLSAGLREAEARRVSDAAANAEDRAQRDAEFTASLAQAAREREKLALELRVTLTAVDDARQERDHAAAAGERLNQRSAELEASLAESLGARAIVEQHLASAESARRHADEQLALERATAAADLAALHKQLEEAVAQAAAARDAAGARIEQLTAAVREVEAARASDNAAHVDARAKRETEFADSLARLVAEREKIALELRVTSIALDDARQERNAAAQERDAAAVTVERLGQRAADLEARLSESIAARATVEQNLANEQNARKHSDERHASDKATAAVQLADLQKQYDEAGTRAAAAHEASDKTIAQLGRRIADLEAALSESLAARTLVEQDLAKEQSARKNSDERHASDMATAAVQLADLRNQYNEAGTRAAAAHEASEKTIEQLNQRGADLEAALSEAVAARALVEQNLVNAERAIAETRNESAQSRRRVLAVASEVRRRSREQKSRLDAQIVEERDERQRAIEEREDAIRQIQQDREAVRQSLSAAQDELRRLNDTHNDERQKHDRYRSTSEAEFQRLSGEYDHARQSLDQVRAAFQTLEQVSSEHAMERARLEGVVADRDAQVSAQAANHLAAEQSWKRALAQLEDTLRLTLDAGNREAAARERQLTAIRQELDLAKSHNTALRSDADRVPILQKQLEEIQKENRRQFHRSPYGMCRCSRGGVISHVNRSFVELLGYRTADDLRKVNLAEDVFEAGADLEWLIERSTSTGLLESLETAWRKKDRSRLTVRLHVLAANDDSFDIVAEDVTRLRALEERLHRAQRMEAVGRLASEVAVTCDNLLRDVSQGGQQWLAGIESDPLLRQQGELLLGEVTRAASFLRQFATYGNQQLDALQPVDVQQVLRDLAPVLKRVAGDDIEMVLPKTSAPVDVDVERERVERVLVNVASYARERMPHGGRVKIDVASTVVDRGFLAKYPNVRPGAHALITVTEVRSTVAASPPLPVPTETAEGEPGTPPSEKTGVELSALLQLIRNCGGHLWVTAEPPGNMVLKIRLPKRVPEQSIDPGASGAQPKRGGALTKWFRHDNPSHKH